MLKFNKGVSMMATIGLIIDVLIIGALVIFGIIGFNKGFLKSFISLFSWVVCIIIAIFTAKYVASWINGIYDFSALIGDKIANGLINANEFFARAVSEFSSTEDIINNLPSDLNGLLRQLIKVVFSNTSVDMSSTDSIASLVGSSLGHICMVIIAGILVFIILKIVIALLSRLFDNIARTKILGGLNKVFGLLFGLLKAGCVIVLLNCILVALSLIPAVNDTITPLIQDNTHIEKVIYNKTDEFIGKYIIEGDVIEDWITDLWNSR